MTALSTPARKHVEDCSALADTGQADPPVASVDQVAAIEHLDFDQQCETNGCDQVATLLATLYKPCCGPVSRICCRPCVDWQIAWMVGRLMKCGRCGAQPLSFSPDQLTVRSLPVGGRS